MLTSTASCRGTHQATCGGVTAGGTPTPPDHLPTHYTLVSAATNVTKANLEMYVIIFRDCLVQGQSFVLTIRVPGFDEEVLR